MYEHLGLEGLTVLPPEEGLEDMSDRMIFGVKFTASPGAEASHMDVSLREMVHSQSDMHLNALCDFMQMLAIKAPQQDEFGEIFQGVDPCPSLSEDEVRARTLQLAKHAACAECMHCQEAAESAVAAMQEEADKEAGAPLR